MDEKNQNENSQARKDAFWDDKSLMELFNRTVTLMRRYLPQRPHNHAGHGDPHRGQGRVLSILKIKPDISQKDLGYLLDMRSQSLGELLMKLEKSGYITRTPSEEDHRVMKIHLTDLGAAAAGQTEKRQADNGRLFDCLNAEEQANLSDYLKRIIIRMDREMAAAAEAYEANRGNYDYDPFWGVGELKDDIHDCCRRDRHDVREHGRALRDHFREHSRQLRQDMREHGRELREELRRDPRLKEYFWGAGDWGYGPDDYSGDACGHCRAHDDPDDRGNGPRPE
jgi:DNA-binding MarR family transcriptional regulator